MATVNLFTDPAFRDGAFTANDPAVRAYAAEFTKESAFGPNGYLRRSGLISAPNGTRARSQQLARALQALNLASLK